MDKIMASMLCSTFEDEPRFTLILKELIQKDSLPDFTAFSKESQKKKKARQKKVVILKRVALTIMGALCIFLKSDRLAENGISSCPWYNMLKLFLGDWIKSYFYLVWWLPQKSVNLIISPRFLKPSKISHYSLLFSGAKFVNLWFYVMFCYACVFVFVY